MSETPRLSELKRSLKLGWLVFPVAEAGKTPVYKGGCRDATRSLQRAVNHWQRYPNHNYGIATGGPSGIFVLDIDPPQGEASLATLCSKYGPLPATVTVITAKGRHLYYKTNTVVVANSAGRLGPGIDVRGDGGYVVGVGSVHPSGHVYRFADGHDPPSIPVALAPPWLLQLVKKPKLGKAVPPSAGANAVKSKRDVAYGQVALDREVQRLCSAPLHQRNDTLQSLRLPTGPTYRGRVSGRTGGSPATCPDCDGNRVGCRRDTQNNPKWYRSRQAVPTPSSASS